MSQSKSNHYKFDIIWANLIFFQFQKTSKFKCQNFSVFCRKITSLANKIHTLINDKISI